MRHLVITLLLAVTLTAAAQEQLNLGLIPTPQRVEDNWQKKNAIFVYPLEKIKVILSIIYSTLLFK